MSVLVYFNSNGGTTINSQLVEIGNTIIEPGIPIKVGNTLEGWYSDSNFINPWEFSSYIVTESMTLYAKWNTNVYIVEFDTDGGSYIENQNVPYLGFVNEPEDPVKRSLPILV